MKFNQNIWLTYYVSSERIFLKKKLLLLIFFMFFLVIGNVAATMNVMVITDPTGKDLNGVAGGSMSYAKNMFQSTFIMSKLHKYVVLSGGVASMDAMLYSIVGSVIKLNSGASASEAAQVANSYTGARILVGGPDIGLAIGGSFDAFLIEVDDTTGDVTVSLHSGGITTLAPGKKGAIIHLRNTPGNPLIGTATTVRKETAVNIGRMIRDGYSATAIVGAVFKEVSIDSGENHGGGAVNLITGVSTEDMFTPIELDTYGRVMSEAYAKSCPSCGWSIGFPAAESYSVCPYDDTPLKTDYAYDALENRITASSNSTSVSVYSDKPGISENTDSIVKSSVNKHGYDINAIVDDINKGIKSGLLVGVNYVEPKDINVKPNIKAVGVYFTPTAEFRSSPPWNLPLNPFILDVIGTIQTVIGIVLILLVIFRTMIIKSFKNR
jgi:hypothetical protein